MLSQVTPFPSPITFFFLTCKIGEYPALMWFTHDYHYVAKCDHMILLHYKSNQYTHTRLHDQIMEVTGGRMQQQQAQVDAVCKDIDQTNAAITKANVAIKTAER